MGEAKLAYGIMAVHTLQGLPSESTPRKYSSCSRSDIRTQTCLSSSSSRQSGAESTPACQTTLGMRDWKLTGPHAGLGDLIAALGAARAFHAGYHAINRPKFGGVSRSLADSGWVAFGAETLTGTGDLSGIARNSGEQILLQAGPSFRPRARSLRARYEAINCPANALACGRRWDRRAHLARVMTGG
jgi:hypothetical protein